jgi:hypothetical protein
MNDKKSTAKPAAMPSTQPLTDQEIVALQKKYPDMFPQLERAPLMKEAGAGDEKPLDAEHVGYSVADAYKLLFPVFNSAIMGLDHNRDGYVDPIAEVKPDAVVMSMAHQQEALYDSMPPVFRGNIMDERWSLVAWKKTVNDPFIKHWLAKA